MTQPHNKIPTPSLPVLRMLAEAQSKRRVTPAQARMLAELALELETTGPDGGFATTLVAMLEA